MMGQTSWTGQFVTLLLFGRFSLAGIWESGEGIENGESHFSWLAKLVGNVVPFFPGYKSHRSLTSQSGIMERTPRYYRV